VVADLEPDAAAAGRACNATNISVIRTVCFSLKLGDAVSA